MSLTHVGLLLKFSHLQLHLSDPISNLKTHQPTVPHFQAVYLQKHAGGRTVSTLYHILHPAKKVLRICPVLLFNSYVKQFKEALKLHALWKFRDELKETLSGLIVVGSSKHKCDSFDCVLSKGLLRVELFEAINSFYDLLYLALLDVYLQQF